MTHNDKYTLVIDGNFFLHSAFGIASKLSSTKVQFKENLKDDRNILLWKLGVNFSGEVKRFDKVIDKIVYCVDGSSWRKYYYSDEILEENPNLKYKGNREKSEDIDWTEVFKTHDEFIEALKSSGVEVERLDGCEADDLIFAWSSYLNSEGKNCIILSGDNDLIQLVNFDKTNGTNTIYYNKFIKSLYTFPGFTKWVKDSKVETFDIFNQPSNIEDNSKDAIKQIVTSLETKEVNPFEFQFLKILKGDYGDNVPSIHERIKVYKSGKKKGEKYIQRLADGSAKKILVAYKQYLGINELDHSHANLFFNKEHIEIICKITKKIHKIEDKTVEELIKKYNDNRNLMILHQRSLPSPIMDSMLDLVSEESKKTMDMKTKMRLRNHENVLETTSYEKKAKEQSTSSSSFFGNFDLE